MLVNNDKNVMIDGTEYYFNLDKIFKLITYRSEKTDKEKEIIDSYEYDVMSEQKLSSKVVRELITPNDSQFDTIKYDLIKTFIIQIITYSEMTEVGIPDKEGTFQVPVTNVNFMPLGTRMVFNTLVEEGILIKKQK